MSFSRPVDGQQPGPPAPWLAEVVVFSFVATFALVVLAIAIAGVLRYP